MEIPEERAGHGVVVMLAGVDENVLDRIEWPFDLIRGVWAAAFIVGVDHCDDRCGFHEVRTGADDGDDLHATDPVQTNADRAEPFVGA
jgi:hypothetical protein